MTDSGQDTSAGYAALDTATQQWADAFNNGDAATIAGMMSVDGQIMPPNGASLRAEKPSKRSGKDSSTRV